MATFNASIVIDAKSNLVKVGKRINKSLKKTSQVLKKTAKAYRVAALQASALGKKTERLRQNMGRLTVVAGVGLVAGIAKSIQVGSDFETSLADLSAITGSTGDQLEFLRQKSLELGRDGVVSAAQVADAFRLVASANSDLLKDPEALAEVTKSVILLSNASGLELTQAANSATQAMNQFGFGAEDANRAVQVLAAGAKVGASEVNETVAALIEAGTTARLLGVSFEETNAAIQVLAKAGIKGSKAGNNLKNVLLGLEEKLNKNVRPSVIGLTASLKSVADASLEAGDLVFIFGREAFSAGASLAEGNERLKDWTKQITGTNIATEQAAKRLATFAKLMEKVAILIQNKLIAVFKRLRPRLIEAKDQFVIFLGSIKIEDIEKFIDSIIDVFNFLGGLKGILQIVGTIFAVKFAVGVVEAVSALITLTKILPLATAAQWLLNIALGANPIGAVILGIGALIAIGVLLVQNWDTVVKNWEDWRDVLKRSLGPLTAIIDLAATLAKAVLPDFVKKRLGIDINAGGSAGAANATTPTSPAQALTTAAPVANIKTSQHLQVDMKIDSEGRPSITSVKSDEPVGFRARLGLTTPIGATR